MHEAWFADEGRVRKTVGLLERPVQFSNAKSVSYWKFHVWKHCIYLLHYMLLIKWVGCFSSPLVWFTCLMLFFPPLQLTCGICFESYPLDRISTAACGHPFCSTCWKCWLLFTCFFGYLQISDILLIVIPLSSMLANHICVECFRFRGDIISCIRGPANFRGHSLLVLLLFVYHSLFRFTKPLKKTIL